jgi:hypothetical protein
MYLCPTVSSNNKKKVFTSREYCHRGQIVARVPPKHNHLNKNVDYLSVSIDKIFKAIMSFPNGSSADLDGIRPQHLKDLIGKGSCDASQRWLLR